MIDWIVLIKDLGILQFVMLIIFLVVIWRLGILPFKKNGITNGHQKQIDEIKTDVRVIKDNHLPSIQKCITEIKTDMAWVKGKLDK